MAVAVGTFSESDDIEGAREEGGAGRDGGRCPGTSRSRSPQRSMQAQQIAPTHHRLYMYSDGWSARAGGRARPALDLLLADLGCLLGYAGRGAMESPKTHSKILNADEAWFA